MGEQEAGFHKFELRHEDDNRLVSYGPTLLAAIRMLWNIEESEDSEFMAKTNLYSNRVFVATGEEVFQLLKWIESV